MICRNLSVKEVRKSNYWMILTNALLSMVLSVSALCFAFHYMNRLIRIFMFLDAVTDILFCAPWGNLCRSYCACELNAEQALLAWLHFITTPTQLYCNQHVVRKVFLACQFCTCYSGHTTTWLGRRATTLHLLCIYVHIMCMCIPCICAFLFFDIWALIEGTVMDPW